MTIDVTLQAKVDGGAPGLSATVPVDAVIQLTAANKDGYRTAYWQIWYYKAGYALPSGWTQIADDAGTPAFQVIGKADPPTFIASDYGGTWTCKLIAEDATGALVEGTDLIIRTAFANGLFPISAREQAQFGGAKASVGKTLTDDIEMLDGVIGATLTTSDVEPTPDTLAMRGPSGEGKFASLQSPSIASLTTSFSALNSAGRGLTVTPTTTTLLFGSCTVAVDASNCAVSAPSAIGLTAGTTITAAATTSVSVTSGTTCTVTASGLLTLSGGAGAALKTTTGGIDLNAKNGSINLQKDSTTAVVCSVDPVGAVSIAPVAGATSVTYQQTEATSGIGKNAVFAAQRGFAGSVGGVSVLGASNGGTGGTNLAGGVALELGQLVSNVSAKAAFWANGSEVGYAQKLASAEFALASAASHDLSLEAATGSLRLKVGGSNSVVWTLSASGAVVLAPVGGAASLTIQPSAKTSGAGAAVVVAGGQGSSGNVGGKTTVGANNGATPGTNLGGGVRVQLGQTVTSVSSAFDIYAGATELVAINSNASYLYQQKTTGGTAGYQAQSGVIVGSNDDTVRAYFNQGGGTVAITGTNGAVRLQDTNVTWLEVARVAASRNVVGLCVGANLDTTKMPANTGNGVLFVGNAGTVPTASCDSTGLILYSEASQLKARNTTGVISDVSLSDISVTSAARKQRLYYEALATTTSTAATALTTLKASQHTGKGAGVAYVRIIGYDTAADRVDVSERSVRYKVVAGVMSVVSTQTIGADDGTQTFSTAVPATDIELRIAASNTNSTKWTIEVDDLYTEH